MFRSTKLARKFATNFSLLLVHGLGQSLSHITCCRKPRSGINGEQTPVVHWCSLFNALKFGQERHKDIAITSSTEENDIRHGKNIKTSIVLTNLPAKEQYTHMKAVLRHAQDPTTLEHHWAGLQAIIDLRLTPQALQTRTITTLTTCEQFDVVFRSRPSLRQNPMGWAHPADSTINGLSQRSNTFVSICNEQTAVSHSSSGAEIISFDAGQRLEGIPVLVIWDTATNVFGLHLGAIPCTTNQ